MGISLKEMLSSVVAIPYEDSLLEIIEKGCQSYIGEIEDSYVDVQELALSFIRQQKCQGLYDVVQEYIESQGSDFHLPEYLVPMLSGYTLKLIIDSEEDKENKAILSTIVMNEMLIIRKNDIVTFPGILSDLFDNHIFNYLSTTDNIVLCNQTDLIEESVSPDYNFSDFDEKRADFNMIVKESALYRCYTRIQSQNIKDIQDVYKRLYVGLSTLINKMEVLSYNFNPIPFIKAIVKEDEFKQHKSISTIVNIIGKTYAPKKALQSKSSILISLIEGKIAKESFDNIGKKPLSPMRFGLQIYYELYIEEYLKRRENGGE